MRVLLDGEMVADHEAAISVFDWALLRGYGCFEVIRSYAGQPFGLDPHVDRLEASAAALEMELPPRDTLEGWVRSQAAEGGNCLVRVVVTSGSRDPLFTSAPRTVVMTEPLPAVPSGYRVLALSAPWAAGGDYSELTGAKTLSYAPNIRATAAAQAAGYHDALLVSRHGHVLEGPTFSVAWRRGDAFETPGADLGILGSITRMAAIDAAGRLGIEVREGRYTLDHLLTADEVMALSTVKEVTPVIAVGETAFSSGEMTARISREFRAMVADDTRI